ncbi:MAG: type II secretion system protein [Patescibacteria group bacterium]
MIFFLHRKKAGFTLVEMIVSVGLFTAVSFIATGSLLSIVLVNKKVQAQQAVMNNLNFALESMTRDIRVGKAYHCGGGTFTDPQDCSGGGDYFSFLSAENAQQYVYRLEPGGSVIEKSTEGGVLGSYTDLTAEEIHINSLSFVVKGSALGDGIQPSVLIALSGYAFIESQSRPEKVDFSLQTTVSQRLIDY